MERQGFDPPSQTTAGLALLLGTVFWGCGFTWAKAAGEATQQAAGLPRGAAFGPVFILAWRFCFAAVIWFLASPASRRGWDRSAAKWAGLVGIFCAAGLIVQHVGLDLTTEAVSAFLTSLTILFVPLLMVFVVRRPPRPALWAGVGLAAVGVCLMTVFNRHADLPSAGSHSHGFALGALLGLACALIFSLYILAVNAAVARHDPSRVTGGQFAIVSIACFVTCIFLKGGRANLHPGQIAHILAFRAVWINLVLLTIFPTLAAFTLLTFFQPRIDPTRAALIYLAEPIFATIYAAVVAGHAAGRMTLIGAALILVANVLAEVIGSAAAPDQRERVALVD